MKNILFCALSLLLQNGLRHKAASRIRLLSSKQHWTISMDIIPTMVNECKAP